MALRPGGAGVSDRDLVQLGAVPDRGGVADPEQVGELERVAFAGLGFIVEPVGAQVPRGDAQPAHGGRLGVLALCAVGRRGGSARRGRTPGAPGRGRAAARGAGRP